MQKQHKPKIKMELSVGDRFMEAFTILLILGTWIAAVIFFNQLPDVIPTHLNAAGQVDGYSSKWSLFFIPAILTVTSAGMLFLSRFPHLYNYPVKVTNENADRVYAFSVRMIRVLALGMAVMFSFIEVMIIRMALGYNDKLFFIIILLIVAVTLFYSVYAIVKLTRIGKNR